MTANDPPHGSQHRNKTGDAKAKSAFSAETRLADLIAADPDAVAVLADLHPMFGRLDDAEARKTMGHLVTLGDAAVITGVPLDQILAALGGGSILECAGASESADSDPPPPWISEFKDDGAVVIDVRPILAGGRDPFDAVMAVAKPLSAGAGLVIHAPFNPLPLRRVLGQMGFDSFGDQIGESHFRVRCRRSESRGPAAPSEREILGAKVWPGVDGVHIDVRGMAAPGPLTAILALIDGGEHDGTIVVHHEREPVYLFPELAERAWTAQQVAGEPGEVRLVLRRDGS